jgi:porin
MTTRSGFVLLGLALLVAGHAAAQPIDVPDTWGGPLASRPRLTGDWGGLRDRLGKKGVVLDVDLLSIPQAVATGGRDTGIEAWNITEYTLNVDTGKLGLWPGGFFKFSGMSGFGKNVLGDSAALDPVNTAALVPELNDDTSGLTNATVTQFLSPKFGVVAGKIFALDSFGGEFAGNIRTQFLNTGVTFPLSLVMVPLSAFGGGVIGLPHEDVLLSALALDANGTVTDNDLGDAFDDGAMVVGSGKVTIRPFGLVGHQTLGMSWSNKERLSLIQDPSNIARNLLEGQFPRLQDPGPILRPILERFFPGLLVPAGPANVEDQTWAMFYAVEQFLWQPHGDPKRGIGVFFDFGASDGKANPIEFVYVAGVGGKGVVPGRVHDSLGLGWARTEFSGNFLPFLRDQLHLGLDREDAIEMYYNAALTGWLDLTLDLQVVEPGLEKKLDRSSGMLASIETAVVPGVRVYARF